MTSKYSGVVHSQGIFSINASSNTFLSNNHCMIGRRRDTSGFVLYQASILFSGHFLRLRNVMKHLQDLQSQGIERDIELQLKLLKPLFVSTYTCSKICYAVSDHRHDFLRKPQTSLKVPRGFISHCKLLPSLQNC